MDQQSEKHDLINEIRQMIDAEPLYNNPDFIHFLCARLDEAENMRDAALARVKAAEERLEAVLDLARRVNYEANQQHKAKLDADLRVCWLEAWLISLGIDPNSAPGKEE